ncbi:hypothetical protein [Echinicola vietnamensis]|uniref:Uncharacterized protein n=1 Tax=Echinicola vietnamensis (strain DSM 17526 / LMG 23754 / KMM 6221) TaxID=926556 RepID=L0FY69_ECHVK|nr:hypothetical protein [Echinicola vietnamensis]AGA77701.1 hypothetical protein Echvi_1435 [Echinicola vietnamensis DSM 17526]
MDQQKYMDDLREIREMMNKSSKFISLSGMSGIAAGIIALIGAFAAYRLVYSEWSYDTGVDEMSMIFRLMWIGGLILVGAVAAGILFTRNTAKRNQQKLWDHPSKRLLVNLAIPIVSGGIFCVILLLKGNLEWIAPLTLVFYGLALINASKYTVGGIRSLGFAEIVLGLLAACFTGYGIWFWAVGFGVLHIVYGLVMQLKYKL